MTEPLKIGVLLSGSGTNLQAIIDAAAEGLPVEIVHVVSSRPDAFGIERAHRSGIPVTVLNRDVYADPVEADKRIAETLRYAHAEYVVMAGYMRKVTPVLLDAFPDRVLNLHPALLPSFKGAHAIQDAFDAGVKVTGITVHFANEDYDKGPIVAQRAVEVREDDTLDDTELYNAFVVLVRAVERGGFPTANEITPLLERSLPDYNEPVPGARSRVHEVLRIMLTAWRSAQLQEEAQRMLRTLPKSPRIV